MKKGIILAIILLISILFLTVSAVIGQFFDFKNTEGTTSKWGFVAVGIALILGLFAIIVEYLEYKEQKKQNKISKANEENRIQSLKKIQLGISNSNNPLVPFRASFTTKTTISEKIVKEISEFHTTNVQVIKTEYLRLIGTVKMGDSPYNFEEERPNKISCSTKDIELINNAFKRFEERELYFKALGKVKGKLREEL